MAPFQEKVLLSLLICAVISFTICTAIYTEETPVKLLSVAALADRYPTAQSKYRVSISRGYVSNMGLFIQSNKTP